MKEYLECDCTHKNHLVCLEWDDEFGLTMHYQISPWQGFWYRVWMAIKYVFTRSIDHRWWDCTTMHPEACEKMERMLAIAKAHGYGEYHLRKQEEP